MTMPRLVNALSAKDRFLFTASLIGFLLRNQYVSVSEVAKHFNVSEDLVKSAIKRIRVTENQRPFFVQTYYNILDGDLYEEEGIITFGLDHQGEVSAQEDAPRLDSREAAAIAMGLNYLKTLPEFAEDADLNELLTLMGNGVSVGSAPPAIEIRPGKLDEDAAVLRSAILSGNRVEFEYINQLGERGMRQIDPIRIDPRENHWYVHGWCLKNDDFRMFRLDRMRNARVLDDPISASARNAIEIEDRTYVEHETDIDVTVAVKPEAFALLGEYQPVDEPVAKANGEFEAVIRIGYLPNLGRLISRFGGAARVIAPVEAKSVVRDHALAVLGLAPLQQSGLKED
jgi:proteasome accessory factor C